MECCSEKVAYRRSANILEVSSTEPSGKNASSLRNPCRKRSKRVTFLGTMANRESDMEVFSLVLAFNVAFTKPLTVDFGLFSTLIFLRWIGATA